VGPLGLALTPAAWVYRAGFLAREAAYRRGWLPSGRLPCAVVSVGNLAVGGTGKTPAVEMVARWLMDDGHRVAIVSRGYGRRPGAAVELVSDGGAPRLSAGQAGDEPLLLARRLPGVPVIVGADRLAAGRWAVTALRPDVVLLDDGFQQRRLRKDVEIVCLDARVPWGRDGLFPRGTLREPRSALARAHLVLLTRAGGRSVAGALQEIAQYAGAAPGLATDYVVEGFRDLHSGVLQPRDAIAGRGILAFAGIAAPERLAEAAAGQGAIVRGLVAFPDHHRYSPRDLEAVDRRARAAGATVLVTTEKDAVRLDPIERAPADPARLPVWVLGIRLEPLAGAPVDAWRAALRAGVERAARDARAESRP
jgi:tetraacyldisaccharide 4'-kinase